MLRSPWRRRHEWFEQETTTCLYHRCTCRLTPRPPLLRLRLAASLPQTDHLLANAEQETESYTCEQLVDHCINLGVGELCPLSCGLCQATPNRGPVLKSDDNTAEQWRVAAEAQYREQAEGLGGLWSPENQAKLKAEFERENAGRLEF